MLWLFGYPPKNCSKIVELTVKLLQEKPENWYKCGQYSLVYSNKDLVIEDGAQTIHGEYYIRDWRIYTKDYSYKPNFKEKCYLVYWYNKVWNRIADVENRALEAKRNLQLSSMEQELAALTEDKK